MQQTAVFATGQVLSQSWRRQKKPLYCARYLPPDGFNIDLGNVSRRGNFGAVFFGEYCDPETPQAAPSQVVVKCPIESSLGRDLYRMEKHTNEKLWQRRKDRMRFAEYMGELIIPEGSGGVSGLARVGLVWRREGEGDTLEDYLCNFRLPQLGSVFGITTSAVPLRTDLAGAVLKELALTIKDMQTCGIVHRDMKPENLLVDVNCSNGTALKAIDFGSSCDWATPFKKGLRLATCDPVYTAPEQRLKMFSPAYRFDIYSIGLITLRCALPSLLEKRQMSNFVENYMSKFNYSLVRTTAAILSKRIEVPQPLLFDMQALTNDTHADLYATLAVMLTKSPEQRADIQDCLNSRFLRRFL